MLYLNIITKYTKIYRYTIYVVLYSTINRSNYTVIILIITKFLIKYLQ